MIDYESLEKEYEAVKKEREKAREKLELLEEQTKNLRIKETANVLDKKNKILCLFLRKPFFNARFVKPHSGNVKV